MKSTAVLEAERTRTRTVLLLTLQNRPAGDEWKPRAWLFAECSRFGEDSVGRMGRVLRALVNAGDLEARTDGDAIQYRAVTQ